MYFFTFLLKNLLRRPARSMLTVVGLAVAVAAVVSLVGVATGFENSFLEVYSSRGVDLVVQRAGGTNNLNNCLPESLLEPLEKVTGVKQVVGGLLDTIHFTSANLMGVLLNGWPPNSPLFARLTIIDGRKFEAGDTEKIIIGRVLAANLGKKVGDSIELYESIPYQVIGIYESPIVFENGGSVVLLSELQRMMNRPGEVTGFTIIAADEARANELKDLRQRIAALPEAKAMDVQLEAIPAADFVKGVSQIKLSRAVAWITSTIALVIGAIGMLNTMIMSVFERTKEIGTLRAIGWKRSRIVRMVIGESLMLSVGGAIVGSLGGIFLVKVLTQLPNAAGIVSGHVAAPVIGEGFLVAILVGVAGAIYPALWSANLLPTEALRRK
jgi:putative ABC transport system permease protein